MIIIKVPNFLEQQLAVIDNLLQRCKKSFKKKVKNNTRCRYKIKKSTKVEGARLR